MLWLTKGLQVGGIERLLCWAAAARDREHFDYEAAYLFPRLDALLCELKGHGLPVHCLGARHELDLRWALRLRRLLLHRRVDVLHLQSSYAAGIARLTVLSMPRSARPRVVCTEHNVWSDYRWPTRLLNALTYPVDDVHLAVSERVRRSMLAPLRGEVQVVAHGVPVAAVRAHLESREAARAQLGIGAGEAVVGTVANLRPAKGYGDLLAAARILLDRGVPVRFLAVGQGPLEEELRALHSSLGLGDSFTFLGFRDDAVHVLAACDVFALASLHEGGPIAVIEALAMGLPVVATAVGVVPDVVTDGVEGRIVPVRRPDLLAGAIEEVVGDPGRRAEMARAAFERGGRLDIRATVDSIEAVYRRILVASDQR